MAVLQQPAAVGAAQIARAMQVTFGNSDLAVVRDAITVNADKSDSQNWLSLIASEVPGPYATLVKQLGVAPIPERPEQLAVYCQGVTTALIDRDLLRRKAELLGALQRTDGSLHPERYAALQRELMSIETERRTLRNE
jgi:DNA primase